ncbi:MAG TPA: DUF2993 domain-containing protein [Nostocaceae cyanobacterium]|nr:DUF2993 domain-containing protein [Nostocaceae cyanobacterium]
MNHSTSPVVNSQKSRIITKVLTAAIKLWLKTQLSQVAQLEVEIKASDRQLLSGCIPGVSISASNAVYQGLHITQLQLWAENIQVNIGAVLRGKPLRLLDTVPVIGQLMVTEDDLNHSLSSALLSSAFNELLVKLLPEHCPNSKSLTWQQITIDNDRLLLSGLTTDENLPSSLELDLGLKLLNGQELQLIQVKIHENQQVLLANNSGYTLNLGSDVNIQEITLIPGQLVGQGQFNVNP